MGPLKGVRVIELAALGPAPFCGMLLADMGAEVIRVDRLSAPDAGELRVNHRQHVASRGRRSIALDLKKPEGVEVVRRLLSGADILIEGFRPGVTESLGLGPEDCLALNPRLVYGRMTGWGQDGPLARSAGHDLNYIALSGALHTIGSRNGPPVPPLNYVGDFGGGALYLAFGVVSALLEARQSGRGQVVDAAVLDGVASLMAFIFTQKASGLWRDERGSNMADGSRPWNTVYETRDGQHVTIAALEPRFYRELLARIGLDADALLDRDDPANWPALRTRLGETFKSRTREEWNRLLEGSDACYSPVLSPDEATRHPHLVNRQVFVERDGLVQPNIAPRFSRTRPALGRPPPRPGEHTQALLTECGFSPQDIARLRECRAIDQGQNQAA
ncbi:CaiB/BaiF CoA transferase family protein [Hydrogenophaga sp. BPS33]|uniref:CaiB/BaiF CoA transferase family protein n=1 Tax=Hydrogenophaga sp. BPS33 TaxID=2651974 RepID=UPI00131FB9A9|nr:CaiB/BaiF CoA-transferase family protein [Hydrogenophaga sp. BPS33]QHE84155.1 CoA transferase [Hydrogenophaga sp. BPS33]